GRDDHREGPPGRQRLRLRAANGPDEPEALRNRHRLHAHQPRLLLPVFEPDQGGRPAGRRHLFARPRAGRAAVEGEVRVTPEYEQDLESRLDWIIQTVAEARSMPLSASVVVNREELLGLLNDLKAALPRELKQARWM